MARNSAAVSPVSTQSARRARSSSHVSSSLRQARSKRFFAVAMQSFLFSSMTCVVFLVPPEGSTPPENVASKIVERIVHAEIHPLEVLCGVAAAAELVAFLGQEHGVESGADAVGGSGIGEESH